MRSVPRAARPTVAPLLEICPSCGATVAEQARFCGTCGLRLDRDSEAIAEGERRQLAVLFCDIVDSTVPAQSLDVEEYG